MLCGQWVASPKIMKLHYQQSHSSLTRSYGKQATALCQSHTTGGTPCTYCGARLAQPKAHKLVCPVLWQFCVIGAIRQETQLQILQQNSAWLVYLQPGANGPIPVLFKAAEKYKEQAKIKFMKAPVRAVLLSTLFLTLLHCLQALSSDAAQQKVVQSKGCIESWHAQAHRHALSAAADYLLVSVDRYEFSNGDTVRHSQSLALPDTVTLPVFGIRATYRIVGIILHSGPGPSEGPYSAILRTGNDPDRGSSWVQDGRQAVHHAEPPVCAAQLCYVLALVRSHVLQ